MADSQTQTSEPTSRGSWIGRVLIVAFIGAVVLSECLFAYFWLPSAEEVAAQVELIARQAQHSMDAGQEEQENLEAPAVEVDLGSFTITNHRLATEGTFRTDFHLWGTVAEMEMQEFDAIFQRNKNRFRSLVIEEIRNREICELEDPGLGLIKRRILEKSNLLLGKPLLRSVVFAEYQFVEL